VWNISEGRGLPKNEKRDMAFFADNERIVCERSKKTGKDKNLFSWKDSGYRGSPIFPVV
jgi:hypothetical protein